MKQLIFASVRTKKSKDVEKPGDDGVDVGTATRQEDGEEEDEMEMEIVRSVYETPAPPAPTQALYSLTDDGQLPCKSKSQMHNIVFFLKKLFTF